MTSQEQFLLVSATVPNLEESGSHLQLMVLVLFLCLVNGLDDDNGMEWGASLRAFLSEERWNHIYRDIPCFGRVTDDGWLKETDSFHPQVLYSPHFLPPSRSPLVSLYWKLSLYITVHPGTTVFHARQLCDCTSSKTELLLNNSVSVPSRTLCSFPPAWQTVLHQGNCNPSTAPDWISGYLYPSRKTCL